MTTTSSLSFGSDPSTKPSTLRELVRALLTSLRSSSVTPANSREAGCSLPSMSARRPSSLASARPTM